MDDIGDNRRPIGIHEVAADDRLIDAMVRASAQSRSSVDDEIERTLGASFLAWRRWLDDDGGASWAVDSGA